MANNVEIKAVARDFRHQQQYAEVLCGGHADELYQRDSFFEVPDGRLKLRQFEDGRGQLIHYHRPDEPGAKLSDYQIFDTESAESLRAVLSRALPLAGEVHKRRRLYLCGQTRIHFDQVQELGEFIELEVVLRADQPLAEGRSIAVDLMTRLEIRQADLIDCAYIDLLNKKRLHPAP